jgi:nicotinate-nucleotide pyrophosphorylase [carboxylating] (EC 2.4.2.19)
VAEIPQAELSDCAMIKDNHIKLYGSISEAVKHVKKILSFSKKIEVEAENEQMAFEACEAGADIVMLDNFAPQEACRVAKALKEKYPHVLIELSGGVNPDKIEEYLCEYIDVISIGRLTSEVKYIDFSLEIE